jgi:hypothetical protein
MGLAMMLAGARMMRATEYDLIAELWGQRGILPAPACNAGQFALARWMLGEGCDGDTMISCLPVDRSEDFITRLLTAEVTPGDAAAEYLARISQGLVAPEMWAQPHSIPDAPAQDIEMIERCPEEISNPEGATEVGVEIMPENDEVILQCDYWTVFLKTSEAVGLHSRLGTALSYVGGGARPVTDHYPFRSHRTCAEWSDPA